MAKRAISVKIEESYLKRYKKLLIDKGAILHKIYVEFKNVIVI